MAGWCALRSLLPCMGQQAPGSSLDTMCCPLCGLYRHVPGDNLIGPVKHDEEVFAVDKVTCVGQIIGVVVADSEPLARRAAKLVAVEYEPLPAIINCEDAIAANSFYDEYNSSIVVGDVDAVFASGACDHIIEGTFKLGGQEHFYLEPQNCWVQPTENDEFLLVSSTQV